MRKENHTTFYNLDTDKQKIILQSAIVEFSRQGYAKASCNRIVRAAGISKGSLFQYFGSKEGLFVFVCDRFIRKVKDAVKHADVDGEGFFALIRAVLISGVDFIDSYPEYFQIYLKVMFEQDVPGRGEFLRRVCLFSSEYLGLACQAAQESGLIRQDVSTEMILFSVDAVFDKFFLSYAGTGAQSLVLHGLGQSELQEKINELVAILEQGLARGGPN